MALNTSVFWFSSTIPREEYRFRDMSPPENIDSKNKTHPESKRWGSWDFRKSAMVISRFTTSNRVATGRLSTSRVIYSPRTTHPLDRPRNIDNEGNSGVQLWRSIDNEKTWRLTIPLYFSIAKCTPWKITCNCKIPSLERAKHLCTNRQFRGSMVVFGGCKLERCWTYSVITLGKWWNHL